MRKYLFSQERKKEFSTMCYSSLSLFLSVRDAVWPIINLLTIYKEAGRCIKESFRTARRENISRDRTIFRHERVPNIEHV